MPRTTKLGGTASNEVVGKIGHGLMMLTWKDISDEDAFETIISGINTLPEGTKMVLNSAEFYSPGWTVANLELLARFFEKYPEYVDKTFLSVKGAINIDKSRPVLFDCTLPNLRRSIDLINSTLRGTKKVDLFQPARTDPNVSIEDTVRYLDELRKEGKFDHIGLSEVSADTLRRAHKVHPIAIAEIEVSPWSYEEETKKVIAACQELDIAVAAYSPLGRGFLTGAIRKRSDLAEGDPRLRMVRFTEENIAQNIAIVDGLQAIANRKGITLPQLCISWVGSLGEKVVPIPGASHKSRNTENMKVAELELTPEEVVEINESIAKHPVVGHRYFGEEVDLRLWG